MNDSDLFERWWLLVWRKEAKMRARAEFQLVLDLNLLPIDELYAATRRQAAHYLRRKTGSEHQLLPATWLKERRWTDELPEVPQSAEASERKRRVDRLKLALKGVSLASLDLRDVREALALGDITREEAKKLGYRDVPLMI